MDDLVAPPPFRILIFGGTGVFGERLVEGLLRHGDFDLVVAGRDPMRLAALQTRHAALARSTGRMRLTTRRLDLRYVVAADLTATGVFAVVDAAGPFQNCDYRLPEAAIAAGLHYLDLADSRAFVGGFSRLDAAARHAGVVALCGVSTTPALTHAVLDTLTAGWRRLDRVETAIAPGNRAPRGLSVVRAILSYAGRPVRIFEDGRWIERPGWGLLIRRRVPDLAPRWFSLVETPDLDSIEARYAVRQTVVCRAGLELSLLHLGLWLASLAVRLGLLPTLAPLAPLFRRLAGWFEALGSDRGGMLVEASGLDRSGVAVVAQWSLLAESGQGPAVPILPMLAALRALAEGRLTTPGAAACIGQVPLAAIEAEFPPYRILGRRRLEPRPSLWRRVLGEAFDLMPEALRRIHGSEAHVIVDGMAEVDGPQGPLASFLVWLLGLPSGGQAVPVSVEMTALSGRELWRRDFAGRRFSSLLSASRTAIPGRMIESFGLLAFELAVEAGASGVVGMPVVAWRLGPLPLPKLLAPRSIARESIDSVGRFRFDVEMRLPLGLGRLVRYRGWLVPRSEPVPVGDLIRPAPGANP